MNALCSRTSAVPSSSNPHIGLGSTASLRASPTWHVISCACRYAALVSLKPFICLVSHDQHGPTLDYQESSPLFHSASGSHSSSLSAAGISPSSGSDSPLEELTPGVMLVAPDFRKSFPICAPCVTFLMRSQFSPLLVRGSVPERRCLSSRAFPLPLCSPPAVEMFAALSVVATTTRLPPPGVCWML